MSIGSCFSANIGQKLEDAKFQIAINPFGILYNPLSIATTLEALLTNRKFTEADIFYHNERWHSFQHHSHFSHPNKDQCLLQINNAIQNGRDQLKNVEVLIITLGTAYTYFLKETNQPVANCHKVPQRQFEKRLLSIEEITNSLLQVFRKVKINNPKLKTILTLSPIRHLKDGLLENQLSKSTLRLAIEEIKNALPNSYYFPAYELVLDDLRDYRFYAADKLHPNETAINYIWEKFSDTFFDISTLQNIGQFQKLNRAMMHRSFNPKSVQHQQFLTKFYQKSLRFQKQFPYLNFEKELEYFKSIEKS